MTNPDRALQDIAAIRAQIAASQLFRGFGPMVVGLSGCLAIVAAFWQSWHPEVDYFIFWGVLAVLCVAMIGVEMVALSPRHHAHLALPMLRATLGKFLPVGCAGASIGAVVYGFAPETAWILPGLWQILIAIGLFAAAPNLPPLMRLAAVWYFLTGLATMIAASGGGPLSPWAMGLPFGLGQILVALCLRFQKATP